MKILLFAGLVMVVLGIASLVLPIPHTETEGIKVGNTNLGLQTSHSERVSPVISVVLIAGGIALSMAGARSRNRSLERRGCRLKQRSYAMLRPLTRLMTSITRATTSRR